MITLYQPDRLWRGGVLRRDDAGKWANAIAPQIGTFVDGEDWDGLVRWISQPVVRPTKESEGAFTLAEVDGPRLIKNVRRVTALGIDGDETGVPVASIHALLVASGYKHVVYTTASSTVEAPRWRAIIAQSRDATGAEHAEYIRHVHGVLADAGVNVDRSAIDPCRLWFVPVVRSGGHWEFYSADGRPFDVDAALATVREVAAEEEQERERQRQEYERRREAAAAKRRAEGKEERDPRQIALTWFAKMDPAISGAYGHNATFRAACFVVANFDASEHMTLMREYNARCVPPWDDADLKRKLSEAAKANPKPLEIRS